MSNTSPMKAKRMIKIDQLGNPKRQKLDLEL